MDKVDKAIAAYQAAVRAMVEETIPAEAAVVTEPEEWVAGDSDLEERWAIDAYEGR